VITSEECAACHHAPKLGPSCEQCHRTEHDWRQGLTGSDLATGPEDAMFGLADCADCHPDVAKGILPASRGATLKGCAECHGEDDPPRDLAGLIAGWRNSHAQAAALASTLDRIDASEPRQTMPDVVPWALGRDPSQGVHNPGLTQALLRFARQAAGLPLEEPASAQEPPKEEE